MVKGQLRALGYLLAGGGVDDDDESGGVGVGDLWPLVSRAAVGGDDGGR